MARHTAFEILYRDYYPRVYGLCRRLLSSAELAEDATQETFMRAYRKFDQFDTTRPFWQWIATIANNCCIDLLRSRSRTKALFGDEEMEVAAVDEAISSDLPVLTELIAKEDFEQLNTTIAALPDKYRVPLVLAYFDQASYTDIAEQLSISRTHVGVLLLRGRQRLRAALAVQTDEVLEP